MELDEAAKITGLDKRSVKLAMYRGYIRTDSDNKCIPASVHNYKFVREVFTDYSGLLAGKFEEDWAMKDQKAHPEQYGCVTIKC